MITVLIAVAKGLAVIVALNVALVGAVAVLRHFTDRSPAAIQAIQDAEYARRQTSASVIDLAARLRSLAQRAENRAAHILEELG